MLSVAAQAVQGMASQSCWCGRGGDEAAVGGQGRGFRIRHAAGALVSVAAGTPRPTAEVATLDQQRLMPLLIDYVDNRVIDVVCRAEVSACTRARLKRRTGRVRYG